MWELRSLLLSRFLHKKKLSSIFFIPFKHMFTSSKLSNPLIGKSQPFGPKCVVVSCVLGQVCSHNHKFVTRFKMAVRDKVCLRFGEKKWCPAALKVRFDETRGIFPNWAVNDCDKRGWNYGSLSAKMSMHITSSWNSTPLPFIITP